MGMEPREIPRNRPGQTLSWLVMERLERPVIGPDSNPIQSMFPINMSKKEKCQEYKDRSKAAPP